MRKISKRPHWKVKVSVKGVGPKSWSTWSGAFHSGKYTFEDVCKHVAENYLLKKQYSGYSFAIFLYGEVAGGESIKVFHVK